MPRRKRKIEIRKCSVCHRTGHNKSTCPSLKKSKPEKKPEARPQTLAKKSTVKNKTVFVKVLSEATQSPHVVDLKDKGRSGIWQNIKVYKETASLQSHKKAAVDFAELVRKANSQQPTVLSKKSVPAKKKISVKSKQALFPKFSFKKFITYHLSLIKSRLGDISVGLKNNFAQVGQNTQKAFNFKRLSYATVTLFLVAAVPLPSVSYYQKIKEDSRRVVEESTNAFLALQSSTVAALQSNIPQAQHDLNQALYSFNEANTIVEKEHHALIYVASLLPVIGDQVSSRQHLLTAGHHLALGNTYLVKGISETENSALTLTEKLAILQPHLRSALPQYKEALADLSQVQNKTLPAEYQGSFDEFKILFASFVNDLEDIKDMAGALQMTLGNDELKRYLVVFQNNHELRPTGGFMGSFAALDLQKGRIINLEVPGGGTYDLQGQLDVFVKPPLALQALNERWEFQDANWFPDFAVSAQKMEWFYEHGRQSSMDGVIAVNASMLERLLKVLGPITNEEHDLELSSNNALAQLQYEVEYGYDKEENKPKEVIGDLLEQFLTNLGSIKTDNIMGILVELLEALEQKEIQVYFNDENLQNYFREFGWTGEILPSQKNQDYLMVVNTNVHGQKSDAKIKQQIEHQAVVQADGSIIDTVFIRREHTGQLQEQFYGGANLSYLRIYVPAGAELIEAGGFTFPPESVFKVPEDWYEDDKDLARIEQAENIHIKSGTRITNEFGKTAFANWVMVPPGGEKEAYFTYKLPFNVFDVKPDLQVASNFNKWKEIFRPGQRQASRYSLAVQKQSGINSEFVSTVIYPDQWQPAWRSDSEVELAANGAVYENVLESDIMYGVVMERVKN